MQAKPYFALAFGSRLLKQVTEGFFQDQLLKSGNTSSTYAQFENNQLDGKDSEYTKSYKHSGTGNDRHVEKIRVDPHSTED